MPPQCPFHCLFFLTAGEGGWGMNFSKTAACGKCLFLVSEGGDELTFWWKHLPGGTSDFYSAFLFL